MNRISIILEAYFLNLVIIAVDEKEIGSYVLRLTFLNIYFFNLEFEVNFSLRFSVNIYVQGSFEPRKTIFN